MAVFSSLEPICFTDFILRSVQIREMMALRHHFRVLLYFTEYGPSVLFE
jgi:hypothetical protein